MARGRGDEDPHPPAPALGWHEGWTFEAWTPDGATGCTTAIVLRPHQDRAWYWAALVRPGAPLVHLADFDIAAPRVGLELRSHGLWASHVCEAPFEQWTVANEAYAVALEDPLDALGRAHGTPTAIAYDLEWYASEPAEALDGAEHEGYAQAGDVHALIELAGGPLTFEGPAARTHWWGTSDPWPSVGDGWPPAGVLAPVALPDGVLERVLTPQGWRSARWPR